MIAVIQCAASKQPDAGRWRTTAGKTVYFVANPAMAPPHSDCVHARPDDRSDRGPTWRELLLAYNDDPEDNPLGLLSAAGLYRHPAYQRLVDDLGHEKVFILSAGWGLISASFLTPDYDITFSASADAYKRRKKSDRYDDLCMLPADSPEPLHFFGGKDYVPLFCRLSAGHRGERIIFYNSATPPDAPGCKLRRYPTTTRTNWHYECVDAFLSGWS